MTNTTDKMLPGDIEALLPWYAAGTLDRAEADAVERALASDRELARRCALVREEMHETVVLNEALGTPSTRVMENLFRTIDKERKTARAQAPASRGLLAWLADLFTPRVLAFSASAAAIVVLLQAGLIAKLMQDQSDTSGPAVRYETSSEQSGSTTRGIEIGSYALVRFAPQATVAEITRFLDGHGATIVDGPRPGGPAGMYRVKIARVYLQRPEIERVLREFTASGLVNAATPTE